MSRHASPEPPDEDGVLGSDTNDVYLPFAGRPRFDDGHVGAPFDDLDEEAQDGPALETVRVRQPPKGLSRRDRRDWQRLEVARVNRQAQALVDRRHGTAGGWSGGFMKNPPRGLGRAGRKAWHTAEQEATTQWWAQRRASNRDIDARAVGALIIAVLIGMAVIVGLVTHHGRSSAAAGSSTVPVAAMAAAPPPTAIPSAANTANTTQPLAGPLTSTPLVPGATGSAAVASQNTAVGVTPTVAPPLAGQWQPTPAGGVPAITPRAATPISPAAVKVHEAPAGAVTAAEQATAQAAVTAWLARTCPSSWQDSFGADLNRGKALETAAAWKLDNPARDTVGAALWRFEVIVHRQTRVCGDFQVIVSPDQPLTAGGGFVLYSADRVVTSAAGHLPVTVEQLSGARRVLKQGGVWRVDLAVVGG